MANSKVSDIDVESMTDEQRAEMMKKLRSAQSSGEVAKKQKRVEEIDVEKATLDQERSKLVAEIDELLPDYSSLGNYKRVYRSVKNKHITIEAVMADTGLERGIVSELFAGKKFSNCWQNWHSKNQAVVP